MTVKKIKGMLFSLLMFSLSFAFLYFVLVFLRLNIGTVRLGDYTESQAWFDVANLYTIFLITALSSYLYLKKKGMVLEKASKFSVFRYTILLVQILLFVLVSLFLKKYKMYFLSMLWGILLLESILIWVKRKSKGLQKGRTYWGVVSFGSFLDSLIILMFLPTSIDIIETIIGYL